MMNPLNVIGEVLKGLILMLVSAPYLWLTGIADAVLTIPEYYTSTVTETVDRVQDALVSGSNRLAAEIEANLLSVGYLSGGILVAALLVFWGNLRSSMLQVLSSTVVISALPVLVASLVSIGLWRCRHQLRAGLGYIARRFLGKRESTS